MYALHGYLAHETVLRPTLNTMPNFLMNEVPLQAWGGCEVQVLDAPASAERSHPSSLQGYLDHQKQPPPRTLQWAYA